MCLKFSFPVRSRHLFCCLFSYLPRSSFAVWCLHCQNLLLCFSWLSWHRIWPLFFFFFLLLTRSGKICVIYLSVLFRNSFLICLMFLGTTLIKAVIWQITRKLTFKKQINHLFLWNLSCSMHSPRLRQVLHWNCGEALWGSTVKSLQEEQMRGENVLLSQRQRNWAWKRKMAIARADGICILN